MSNLKSFQEKKQEIKAKLEEAKKMVLDVLKQEVKDLFNKNPNIISFSWNQYTPYWNDGGTCYFSCNKEYSSVKLKHPVTGKNVTWDGDSLDYDGPDEDCDKNGSAPKFIENALNSVEEFLNNFDDDDMQNMFGDHTSVKILKNENGEINIETEEYDHD